MTQPQDRAKGFSAFRQSRPAAPTAPTAAVGFEPLLPDRPFPLLARPQIEGVDAIGWAAANRALVEAKLYQHGALLFRGFDIGGGEGFRAFAASLCDELFSDYGDLPHEEEGKGIYRSTPYPEEQAILFHNESSHLHRWPMKQWFFCLIAARERGETPIVDCREVYRRLEPAVRDRFAERGLCYMRNFTDGVDVSWQHFFRTDDKAAAEAMCRRVGMEFEWHADGGLTTRQRCSAVSPHPRTGEPLFFNQIQLHHVACLDPETRQSLYELYGETRLPRNVYYGDGTPIEDSLVEEITNLYWDVCVEFPWQAGDLLMVDNMLIAHARRPFAGERKMLVAMAEMMSRDELAAG